MAIIEKPINPINVANILGYYEYKPHPVTGVNSRYVDLGRLCTHPNINKWAKYKPVRFNSVVELTEAQIETVGYGIKIPIYSNVQAYVDGLTMRPNVLPVWEYQKPVGGTTSPYRLGDFINYDKNAIIPFGLFNVTNRASKTGGNPIITGSIGFIDGSDPYQLRLQDFNFGNRRFAMAYRKSGDTTFGTVVGNAGDFSVDLNVNDANLTNGTYEAFLFMTNNVGGVTNILGFEGHPKPNIFDGTGLIFKVVTQTVTVSIEAMYSQFNQNQIIISIKSNNETGGAVNLLNSILQVRSSTNECDSTIQEGEVFRGLGTLVAPAGNNIVHSETITIDRGKFPMWKVCWRNSGVYPQNFFTNIIQEM